jgi:flavin reductase (DIM6/NTAB) family NADH-FMN oxidoreductase RutF
VSEERPVDGRVDGATFDDLMSSLDPPLVVVTTAVGDERGGCLVGFHAQAGIDPDRYCVWLSKANHTYRLALRATHLGIHFLAEDQLWLAERFGTLTGDDVDKLDGVSTSVGVGDLPLLDDVPNRLLVRRVALLDEGSDHVCITAAPVVAETSGRFRPLRLSAATDLVPGHENEERHNPPTERAAD